MALRSTGSLVRVRKVISTTPYSQTVQVYAFGRNSPKASTEYKVDFMGLFALYNGTVQVKEGDLLYIKAFTVRSFKKELWEGGFRYIFNVTDWELKGQYDYKKLHYSDIEYKGADYDEDDD